MAERGDVKRFVHVVRSIDPLLPRPPLAVVMTLRGGRDGLTSSERHANLDLLLIEDPSADGEFLLKMIEHRFPRARKQVVTSLDAAMPRLGGRRFDLVLVDLSLPVGQPAPIDGPYGPCIPRPR